MNDRGEEKTPRKEGSNQLCSFDHDSVWFSLVAISLNLLSDVVSMAERQSGVKNNGLASKKFTIASFFPPSFPFQFGSLRVPLMSRLSCCCQPGRGNLSTFPQRTVFIPTA